MMANEAYKARARRLAAHLKSKHGVTLSHSAALEAVAAEEGARDWNTLAARTDSGAPGPSRSVVSGSVDEVFEEALKAAGVHWYKKERPDGGYEVRHIGFNGSFDESDLLPPTMIASEENMILGDRKLPVISPRQFGSRPVLVQRSIWDLVDVKPRVRHAIFRLTQVVTGCISSRRNDCGRGAETGRLSATLLQKEAMGVVRGAEEVFEALEFPASLWREACGQLGKAVDQATSELDAGWCETARERWAARPADLKL